jgi:hypothetical protein
MGDELPTRYLTLDISDKGVTELDDDHRGRLIFIPRAQVVRLRFAVGRLSERPLIEGLFGAVMLLGGIWFTYSTAGYARALVLLVLLGGYSLSRSLRSGPFLQVDTHQGMRKLLVRGSFDPATAKIYLEHARDRFDYQIAA